jgi:hypothetical protein
VGLEIQGPTKGITGTETFTGSLSSTVPTTAWWPPARWTDPQVGQSVNVNWILNEPASENFGATGLFGAGGGNPASLTANMYQLPVAKPSPKPTVSPKPSPKPVVNPTVTAKPIVKKADPHHVKAQAKVQQSHPFPWWILLLLLVAAALMAYLVYRNHHQDHNDGTKVWNGRVE